MKAFYLFYIDRVSFHIGQRVDIPEKEEGTEEDFPDMMINPPIR